jgi:general secretion pathway protein C
VEWLFRRHFWIVHLAFLALAAIILAVAVNVPVEYWLTKKFTVPEKKAVQRPTQPKVVHRDFSIANERNLFEAKREVVAPAEGELAQGTNLGCERWEEAVPTTLRARLLGTAVFPDPRNSLALIEDSRQAGGLASSYSVNECPENLLLSPELTEILGRGAGKQAVACNRLMDTATIKRIDVDKVYFYNDAERRCEFVAMEGADLAPPPPRPAPMAAAPGDDFGKSVRKVGPNSFEIDSSDLENALNNLSQLSTQARVVPAFEDGKPIGFKFFSIRPNSAFSRIGFENGDIITKINGYDLNSPDKAIELYQKLRVDSQFNVQGKRGGANFNYDYNVKR